MTSLGRIEQHTLESHALKGNYFKDPTTRPLLVYLPPNYDASRRYPVLYVLPAHGATGLTFLNWRAYEESMPDRLNRLMGVEGVPAAIVVMPDNWTALGSSQYLNSVIGRYEDYLIKEVVPFIDSHYPTAARGVLGFSSGGYGAIVQAMRHPDVFSAVACHASDMYWEYTCLPDLASLHQRLSKYGGAEAFLKDVNAIQPKGGAFWKTIMSLCWSMAHGTNPDAALGFDLPIDPETGALNLSVWERWLTFDPIRMIDNPDYQAALRGMKQVLVTAGSYDEYQLQVGARLFSKKLTEYAIPHIHEEVEGAHSGSDVPYDRMIRLLVESLV
jgi:S-formylglutathione hydrolase FrmB